MHVEESVAQWIGALRRMTFGGPAVENPALNGITAVWANVNLPFYNHAVVSSPVKDANDLRSRLDPLLAFASERSKGWLLTTCDAWMPDGAREVLLSAGLQSAVSLTGMVTDAVLPTRSRMRHDIRPMHGTPGSVLIGELNCAAYGMPAEWATETGWASFFGDDVFSFALYENEVPASTATVMVIEDCLNVVCVATRPIFQRKGYAEAVMRYALADASKTTGLRRTVLHASRAGYPIYKRMGYEPVVEFTGWTPSH